MLLPTKCSHNFWFVVFRVYRSEFSVDTYQKLTRSLRSLVRFLILHNSWIKVVRAHFPWSNLYISGILIISVLYLIFTCIEFYSNGIDLQVSLFSFTAKNSWKINRLSCTTVLSFAKFAVQKLLKIIIVLHQFFFTWNGYWIFQKRLWLTIALFSLPFSLKYVLGEF